MAIQVPDQYILSSGGADWRADYVGSGRQALEGAGIRISGDMEQWKLPEGTMVVAAPGQACVLVTASPDSDAALERQDPADYHLYRLTALGQLQEP